MRVLIDECLPKQLRGWIDTIQEAINSIARTAKELWRGYFNTEAHAGVR